MKIAQVLLKHFDRSPGTRANFDRNGNIARTMKKVLKVSALVMAMALLFSACKSAHSCPAYGKKAEKAPAEEQC